MKIKSCAVMTALLSFCGLCTVLFVAACARTTVANSKEATKRGANAPVLIDLEAVQNAPARDAVSSIRELLAPVEGYKATVENAGLSLFGYVVPSHEEHYGRRPDKLRLERTIEEEGPDGSVMKARTTIVCDGQFTLLQQKIDPPTAAQRKIIEQMAREEKPDDATEADVRREVEGMLEDMSRASYIKYEIAPLTASGDVATAEYLAAMANLLNLFAQYKPETLELESESAGEWVFVGECNYAMMPWAMTRLVVDKRTGFPKRLETDQNQFLQARQFIRIGKKNVITLLDVKTMEAANDLPDSLFRTDAPPFAGDDKRLFRPEDGTAFMVGNLEQRLLAVKQREKAAAGRKLSPAEDREAVGTDNSRPPDLADGDTIVTNSIGMKLRRIAPGKFQMGSPDTEKGRDELEGPVREVTLTKPFLIGVFEVTQGEWKKVMGNNPAGETTVKEIVGTQMAAMMSGDAAASAVEGEYVPVTEVSWLDAREFCRKLSTMEKKTYRLPTEAEWEYACRAGSVTAYSWGEVFDTAYGWIDANSGNRLHAVGQRKPNPWGLYDMNGNAWEWCEDWFARYEPGGATDPKGPEETAGGGAVTRVSRGGSFKDSAPYARSAHRNFWFPADARHPLAGFRVVMEE